MMQPTYQQLAHFIETTPLTDTHEHLQKEDAYVQHGPDVLQDLFDNYIKADLRVAGATQQAVDTLLNDSNPDLDERWHGIRDYWEVCQFSGYGQAVRLIADKVYGFSDFTPESFARAADRNRQLRQPGQRHHILAEAANLTSVQVDDFVWACNVDRSGPDFFLYDLSWWDFGRAEIDLAQLFQETGIEVNTIKSLRAAMEVLFAKYGQVAVAVKSQHAYNRTLRWEERSDSEAERALQQLLRTGNLDEAEQLCLGDWCLAQGIELAQQYDLPVKLHTGYYARVGLMPIDRIRAGHLCQLLQRYPTARFVLMHTAYPYSDELVAIAKQYPNVYLDLCWAWAIDPYSTTDFVRRVLYTVPVNKLFAFGGDTSWPNTVVAYAWQARQGLLAALEAEVIAGTLTETQAIAVAQRMMQSNQEECFRLEAKRASLRRAAELAD